MESALSNHIDSFTGRIRRVHLNVLFSIGFFSGLPFFLYQINPDAVVAIGIARHYINGEWLQAINGYWSPLISWLLTIPILFHIPALLAYKLISFFSGLLAINLMYHILHRVRVSNAIRMLTILIMIPYLIYFSLSTNTPDLLSFTIWLLVILQLLKLWSKPNYRNRMLLALLGMMACFARYYHFYAFTGSAVIFLLMGRFKDKKLNKDVLTSLFAFISLTGIWMLIIDFKYNRVIPALSSDVNVLMSGKIPASHPAICGNQPTGLDYTQYTFTSWEEPAWYAFDQEPQPFSTAHFFQLLGTKIKPTLQFYLPVVMMLILGLCFLAFRLHHFNSTQWLLLALSLLYPAGFAWIAAEPRHFLFPLFGLLTLSIHLLLNPNVTERYMKVLIIALFAAAFCYPVYQLTQQNDQGATIRTQAQSITSVVHIKGERIMSSPDAFWEGMYFAYFTRSVFCDALKPELISTFKLDLADQSIHYFLCHRNEIPPYTTPVAVSGNLVLVHF